MEKLLKTNNVVLDFGFWTKVEREAVSKRFSKHNVKLVYMDLSEDEILKQLEFRNTNLKQVKYFIDMETFKILSSKFETPKSPEKFLHYNSTNNFIKSLLN